MLRDPALAAERGDRATDFLPINHKKIVDWNPVSLGELGPKRGLGFIRILGLYVPPSVGDAMDMNVDTDPGFGVTQRDHQVGGFPSDPLECEEVLDGIRDPPLKTIDQMLRNLPQRLCLVPVESTRKDGLLDGCDSAIET